MSLKFLLIFRLKRTNINTENLSLSRLEGTLKKSPRKHIKNSPQKMCREEFVKIYAGKVSKIKLHRKLFQKYVLKNV